MRGSVSIDRAASSQVVWDLASDMTSIGEVGPETLEARWTRGSSGLPVLLDRLRGRTDERGMRQRLERTRATAEGASV